MITVYTKLQFLEKGEQSILAKSEENLKEAFAEKSQGVQKYLAFSDRAKREGFPQIARLFKAAAEAGAVRACNHLMALRTIAGTEGNLREAISIEAREFEEMYPKMLGQARTEEHKLAEWSFTYALVVERLHVVLYRRMLDNLGSSLGDFL
jgi:rubrerythrin